MKNNILYLTTIPSPFQLEFLDFLNKNSVENMFVPVFMSNIPEYRKTWGRKSANFILVDEVNVFNRCKKIIGIIKENQPRRIILTQYNKLHTLLVIMYAIIKGIPYYFGPIENMHKRNTFVDFFKKQYFSLVTKKAQAIFAIGNHAAYHYAQLYTGTVYNIPYSFDLKSLYENNRTHETNNITTFLYSGRLVPFRNPILVIECFAELQKKYKNIRLIMSGSGILKKQCNALIQELKIGQMVAWKNEFIDWYDIHKRLYRQADVLLALQHHSSWGLIIQEAMAAGLGIIATRSMESTNELIVDRYNGFLVSLDKTEIISKMEAYICDIDLIRLHARRSRDMVQVIDLSNVGEAFLEVFGVS